ncbi:MAG: disulfide bond formation protein B [Zoogloeaceae bacterium]|jgi:disulfide bond formation protein DsbB|nr:disulfide bond formation protein B [Zoogloeaceae bacterium]
MNPITFFLRRLCPWQIFLLLGIAACLIFASSVILQAAHDLSPCPLCIFQRLLFLILGLLALFFAAMLALFSRLRLTTSRATPWMCGALILLCLGGLSVAVWQSLMQAVPNLVTECSYTDPGPIERFIDWLGIAWMEALDWQEENAAQAMLSRLFYATGTCASKEWTLFGLSLANCSAVAFFVFGVSGIVAARHGKIECET